MAVTIGFDAPFDPRQFPAQLGVGEELRPPTQVKFSLILLRGQLDGQVAHDLITTLVVLLPPALIQVRFGWQPALP